MKNREKPTLFSVAGTSKPALWLTLLAAIAGAQLVDRFLDFPQYAGGSAAPFLSLPAGAKDAVFKHASLVMSEDAHCAFVNPAALGLVRRHEFSFSHSEMPLGVRNEYLAFAFPRDYLGALGFYSRILTPGAFTHSRDINENPNNPTMLEWASGISYGGALVAERFYVGVGAGFLQSRLDDQSARAYYGDAAMEWVGESKLRIALGFRNFGTNLQYGSQKEPLPASVTLGVGKTMGSDAAFQWGLGVNHQAGSFPEASIGLEQQLGNRMTIRAGYSTTVDSFRIEGLSGLSLGTGFREKRYVFDYAWAAGLPGLGSSHYLSVAATFKEIKPKTAEDYHAMAVKHYKKGKYKKCIEEAENALRMNPNMWQSHALIARAHSVMRKTSGIEIAIIYTANTNGFVTPQKQGNIRIGGMARRATVVRTLASHNPYHLILDAGNLFGHKTEPVKIRMLTKAMARMGYSVLGVGAGELKNGLDQLGAEAAKNKLQYVATNVPGAQSMPAFALDYTAELQGKYRVYVVSILGTQFQGLADEMKLKIKEARTVLRKRLENKGHNAHLRIAIVNDQDETARYLARTFPMLDVIICGGSGRIYSKPLTVGRSLVLSSGRNGHYVGSLSIRFNENREIMSHQHRLVPLIDEVKEDPEIADLMTQMLIRAELESQGDSLNLLRGNMNEKFLFVSDLSGSKQVYVRFLKNNLAYRLTHGPYAHHGPKYSPENGKVAYLREWTDTTAKKAYTDLWTMEMAGARKIPITHKETVKHHQWHPSGKHIYFSSDSTGDFEIYRNGPEGGLRVNVSNAPRSNETQFAFSSAGKDMAFVSDRDRRKQVYLTGKAGDDPIRMTEEMVDFTDPQYSPDGKYLTYLSNRIGFGERKDLVLHRLQTNEIKYLTQNANVRQFVWKQDSKAILFDAGANLTDLTVTDLKGDMHKLLLSDEIKKYSEQCPTKLWYLGEEWILYEVQDRKGTKIHRVKIDGTDNQPTVIDAKNSWLQ